MYSFRRCPYAMRARMALLKAGLVCELREVVLRDKPAELLAISARETVPVLHLPNGNVLQESLDIMLWALRENDPDGWLLPEQTSGEEMFDLVSRNDHEFKYHLDRYKYPERFDLDDGEVHRDAAAGFLQALEARLLGSGYLCGNRASLADVAVFPFIRQFAHVDSDWFAASPFMHLRNWLHGWLESDLFAQAMPKIPRWQPEDAPVYLRQQT
ncbi:MAG: glutathione S-transferase [Mariprofundaceae bacterium]